MSSRKVALPQEAQFQQVNRLVSSQQRLTTVYADTTAAVSSASPVQLRVELPKTGYLNPAQSYFTVQVKVSSGATTTTECLKQGVMSAFRSCRVSIGGRLVEHITNAYIWSRMMFECLNGDDTTDNSAWMSGYDSAANRTAQQKDPVGEWVRYSFKIPSGLLSSQKLLPLWAMPQVAVEFEFNGSNEGVLVNSSNSDEEFSLRNLQYKAELHDMSPEYNAAILAQINSAEGLEVMFPSIECHTRTLDTSTQQNFEIASTVRSAKTLFLCQRANSNISDVDADYSFIRDSLDEVQLEIGSQVYPNIPTKTGSESFAELQKALKRQLGAEIPMSSISYSEYYSSGGKHFIGYDLERFLTQAALSGQDLASHPLNVRLTFSAAPNATANRLYAFIVRDTILKIHENHRIEVIY